jgi:hypothetical protein
VLHQIGAGTLGPVFRAYEPDRDRLVAVKLFRLDLPPERVHQLVDQFEQLIAADLAHPVIAAALATGIDGVNPYLAQDYVTADSLDIVVRETGPARTDEAVRVAAQLAEALDYAADRQIVHGALHPRDVLMSPDELRLVGLGVTRALERVGAPPPNRRPYTAPERIGGGAWDRRADVFSLAAVIHELLWGRRLSGTGSQAALGITDAAGGNLAALREVFACALADDMSGRFATATEFATALAGAFEGAAVTTPSAKRSPVARRTGAPRPVAAPRLPLDGDDDDHVENVGPDLALRAPEPPPYHEVEVDVDDLPADAPLTSRPAATSFAAIEPFEPREPREPREAMEPEEPRELREPTFAGSFLSPPAPAEPSGLSLMWPLALAAVVGSALGFGAGYAVAIRDRHNSVTAGNSASVAAQAAADQAAGRELIGGAAGDPETPRSDKDKDVAKGGAAGAPQPTASATATRAAATPPASKPAAAAAVAPLFAGRVLVRSTPPGVRVFVDGRSGGETPATVHDLARGAHQVRLVREGYTTVERKIVITASKPALTLTVPMVKVPVVSARLDSALVVISRPAGATVFLDGREVGTTPLTLPGVKVGPHAMRIELDGYQRWSSAVQIAASDQNRVTASLER